MPITILDYVKSKAGEKDTYTGQDCADAGVQMIGGCQICAATIAIYNAYPSTSGYWKCADCIGDSGFPTVEAFGTATPSAAVWCPCCGEDRDIRETPTGDENTQGYCFECGECGTVWTE